MEEQKKSPIKAIRAKCLECCYDSAMEVKLCEAKDCPLWAFRMGKNPNMANRHMTEEQRTAAAERLKQWHFKSKAV